MTQNDQVRILSSFLFIRGLVPEDTSLDDIRTKAELVRSSIEYLIVLLDHSNDDEPEETLQSVFFEAGKLHFAKELRWWFSLLYNMLIKQNEGARLGMIAKIMTIQWMVDSLTDVMSDPWMNRPI